MDYAAHPVPLTPKTRSYFLKIATVTFVLALLFRLALLFTSGMLHDFQRKEMERIAISYADSGVLANPYAAPSGPTAHLSPIYPVLLGTVFRIFGIGAMGAAAKGILACIASALRCSLMVPFCILLGLSVRRTWVVAVLGIIYVAALRTEVKGDWDGPFSALALMLLVYLAIRAQRPVGHSAGFAVVCGCCCGVALLLNSSLFTVVCGFLVAGAWYFVACREYWYPGWACLVVFTIAVCLTPWTVRNYVQLHSPIWSRSNLGLEMFMSFHAGSTPTVLESEGELDRYHPTRNVNEAVRVRTMGEVAYNQSRAVEATTWMKAHPADSLRLISWRIFYFWFPPADSVFFCVLRSGLTFFAAFGFVVLYRRNQIGACIFALAAITYPLTYYLFMWSSRYRYPMEWILVLFAGIALGEMMSRVFGSIKPDFGWNPN